METSTSEWVKFFKESGLPTPIATKYAVIFTNHRINFDMLKDLTKEILYDMGINTMGDVIAILRHAKNVDEETHKKHLLGSESFSVPALARKQIQKPVKSVPKEQTIALSKRGLNSDAMPAQRNKIRKIIPPKEGSGDLESCEYMSQESTYVIKMPNIMPKAPLRAASFSSMDMRPEKSVFGRLGAETGKISIQPQQTMGTVTTSQPMGNSVFSRLGSDSETSTVRVVALPKTSSSILRGAGGATQSFSTKATATVKPTNVLIRRSLAEVSRPPPLTVPGIQKSGFMSNQNVSNVKNRLGEEFMAGNGTRQTAWNTSKRIVVTRSNPPKTTNNTISLKKSIFDRLGS